MVLGTVIKMSDDLDAKFAALVDMGFHACQLINWKPEYLDEKYVDVVLDACKKYDVTITAYWCGYEGPIVWNFTDGPATLGLVPPAYRFDRLKMLKKGADFAKKIGVTDVVTHAGFLPENPNTTEYEDVLVALKDLCKYLKANEQRFLFETGQETPTTLLRVIQDIGTENVGINLDPANLILYGKGNPIDALTVFGQYVYNVHGKDGNYPTDGKKLGKETPIGEGMVNFPAFIQKLKDIGYDGPIIIEREISGDQQIADIKASKIYLEELIG